MDKQELLDVLEEQIIKEKEEKDAYGETDTWIGGYKDGRIDALTFAAKKAEWLDEPEKPEVPKEFDEWYKEIQEIRSGNAAKRFALWKICQFGFGCGFEDVKDRKIINGSLTNWVINHKEEAVNAVLNGYTVKKEPVWIVKAPYDRYFGGFLERGNHAEINFNHINRDNAQKFDDKDKAQAVATLIDGEVETL